jgi:hypothetical protein
VDGPATSVVEQGIAVAVDGGTVVVVAAGAAAEGMVVAVDIVGTVTDVGTGAGLQAARNSTTSVHPKTLTSKTERFILSSILYGKKFGRLWLAAGGIPVIAVFLFFQDNFAQWVGAVE